NTYQFDTNPAGYLQNLNHNPLDLGDNLSTPNQNNYLQTWWGFPTWRETLSFAWVDPTRQVNDRRVGFAVYGQPAGLTPRPADVVPVADDPNLLPPMAQPNGVAPPGNLPFSDFRPSSQLFCDAKGATSAFWAGGNNPRLWPASWEDDLVLT